MYLKILILIKNSFNELFNLNNKKNKLNINDLGYLIGPILNAGGRLGKSNMLQNYYLQMIRNCKY